MTQSRIVPALDNAIGFNIYRVALLFRNELMRALAEYDLTPEQWQVMQTLWATEESLNQNDVAYLTLKDRHTVSRILARLERDGWITKRPDAADARAYLIEPTARAQALQTEVPTKLFTHFINILSVLDEGEAEQFVQTLKKLRRKLGDPC